MSIKSVMLSSHLILSHPLSLLPPIPPSIRVYDLPNVLIQVCIFFYYLFFWSILCEEEEVEVAQSCPTLCDPIDFSLPGSSVHAILQARILERVAISFSTGSSQSRDRMQVSRIAGIFFTIWVTREAHILESWSIKLMLYTNRFHTSNRHWGSLS